MVKDVMRECKSLIGCSEGTDSYGNMRFCRSMEVFVGKRGKYNTQIGRTNGCLEE